MRQFLPDKLAANPVSVFSTSMLTGGFLEIVFFILVFVCILFLAYITTKYVAKKGGVRYKGRYIEVVDSVAFGVDRQLMVVKVVGEFFLIAKTPKGFEMLTTLNLEEEQTSTGKQEEARPAFRDFLEKRIHLGESGNTAFRNNLNKIKNFSEKTDGDPVFHEQNDKEQKYEE